MPADAAVTRLVGLGAALSPADEAQLDFRREEKKGLLYINVFDTRGEFIARLSVTSKKWPGVPNAAWIGDIDVEAERWKRRGLGTRLYEMAAAWAFDQGLNLVSSQQRSDYAEAFWSAQHRKGRVEKRAIELPEDEWETEDNDEVTRLPGFSYYRRSIYVLRRPKSWKAGKHVNLSGARGAGGDTARAVKHSDYREWNFAFDCVSANAATISHIIDKGERVELRTIARALGAALNEWAAGHRYSRSFPLSKDWAVGFYRSWLPDGTPVWYVDWSAIEHVFVPAGYSPDLGELERLAEAAEGRGAAPVLLSLRALEALLR